METKQLKREKNESEGKKEIKDKRKGTKKRNEIVNINQNSNVVIMRTSRILLSCLERT